MGDAVIVESERYRDVSVASRIETLIPEMKDFSPLVNQCDISGPHAVRQAASSEFKWKLDNNLRNVADDVTLIVILTCCSSAFIQCAILVRYNF